MAMREPWRRRRRRRREVGVDAAPMQKVEHAVEPAEFKTALGGFEPGPGENSHRHEVDARLLHEADVLGPDFLRPLLGVVIAAVKDVGRDLTLGRAQRQAGDELLLKEY